MHHKSAPFLGHEAVAYNLKVKKFDTSSQLRGVKNDLCIGMRPDPLLWALILQAIKNKGLATRDIT